MLARGGGERGKKIPLDISKKVQKHFSGQTPLKLRFKIFSGQLLVKSRLIHIFLDCYCKVY
jgi:hypothetical protein